jgi:hypothetical protein
MYELDELDDDEENGAREGQYSDDEDARGDDGASRKGGERWGAGTSKSTRRPSDSTVASSRLYTPEEEEAVVRKFDRRLVVFLAFCYMLSFVDRSSGFSFSSYPFIFFHPRPFP